MARVKRNKSNGYFEVSTGAAQIQIHSGAKSVGVIHSALAPDSNVLPDFIIRNGAINYSFGTIKCFLIAMSSEEIDIGYTDIS